MMTILHGDDLVKSRRELENLKTQKEKDEVIVLSGEKVTLTEVKQALEAKSLFGQEKIVVLENLVSAKRKGKEQEKIIEYLKEEPNGELILWEDQELGPSVLRVFPQAKVRVFKPDPLLFSFLETLRPGNNRRIIEAFRQALSQEEVNLVFYMLIRQFRLLLFLKTGEKGGFEEAARLADWQKAKIERQTQSFTLEQLLAIYRQLLEIDWREKTGLSSYPLNQTLELFLANL